MIVITDERCTQYAAKGHPERPSRISSSLEFLRAQSELNIVWSEPLEVEDASIQRVHPARHMEAVKNPDTDFDGDTPAYPDIYLHARRSVGTALKALEYCRKNETSFGLIRPPGHHATQMRAMGFCYFNSIAISVMEAMATGAKKVAVFDFDVHHGNGTEAIMIDEPNTLFVSVHQHPCFPGTGTRHVGANCRNYPVPPQTPRLEYREILETAFNDILDFKPDLLAVSAGFDAYKRDPIAQELLEIEDFHWIGTMIKKSGIPFYSVLEGGYSRDLCQLIFAYLKGIA